MMESGAEELPRDGDEIDDDEVVTTTRKMSPDHYISFLDSFMMPFQNGANGAGGGFTSRSKQAIEEF